MSLSFSEKFKNIIDLLHKIYRVLGFGDKETHQRIVDWLCEKNSDFVDCSPLDLIEHNYQELHAYLMRVHEIVKNQSDEKVMDTFLRSNPIK